MSYLYFIKFLTFFCFWTVYLTGSNFKDTTTLIQEWVQTEQLIGEESTDWHKEKAALIDIRDALNKEIVELDQRLAESEEEAVEESEESEEEDDYYNEIYHLMGDPSLMTYLGVPAPLSVQHDQVIPLGLSTIDIISEEGVVDIKTEIEIDFPCFNAITLLPEVLFAVVADFLFPNNEGINWILSFN